MIMPRFMQLRLTIFCPSPTVISSETTRGKGLRHQTILPVLFSYVSVQENSLKTGKTLLPRDACFCSR